MGNIGAGSSLGDGDYNCLVEKGMRHSSRLLASALSGEKMELLKRSSTAHLVAPILVNCAGSTSSEESDQTYTYVDQGESLLKRVSNASCCSDASTPSQPIAAERISQADLQNGNYKVGVRYCTETWPDHVVLRVRSVRQ